ncbi:MAG: 3-phosphoglycerate dehydrogenase [Bacteroidetes bacterium]|nr:3-phosphoglycerate dehydrogenase [Bacteroidota bacterium]
MKRSILITVENFNQDFSEAISVFNSKGFKVEWIPLRSGFNDTEKMVELVADSPIVIAGGEFWSEKTLKKLKNTLRVIVRFGSGFDKIDIDSATKYGIAVVNSPGTFSRAVAEAALALVLTITREIPRYNNELKNGIWKPRITTGLSDKKIGILGFGSIGREFARLIEPFTSNIMYYDKYAKIDNEETNLVKRVSLDVLVCESDIISINLPLNNETERMVDKNFLKKMKTNAILVNTSRGRIINETDLIAALQKKEILAAGLDVFDIEPLSNSNKLKNMENVVLTPHSAALTEEAVQATITSCIESIIKIFSTGECKHLLNPEYIRFRQSEK